MIVRIMVRSMLRAAIAAPLCAGILALAQAQPAVTLKELMLDLIHPASNSILLAISRGGPSTSAEWAEARRSALNLAECGTLLTMPSRARDQGDWSKDAKMLADAGAAAYKAALEKNANALRSAADALDNSCTTCHKQYRPNVFPSGSASK